MFRLLIFFLVLILISNSISFGQDQRIGDSLEIIYQTKEVEDHLLPDLLYQITRNQTNPTKRLSYADLLESATANSLNLEWPMKINFQRGLANMENGELKLALSHFFKSLEVAEALEDKSWMAKVYVQISSAYSYNGNHSLALPYSKNAIELISELDQANKSNIELLANATLSLGGLFMETKQYDSALIQFEKCIDMFNDHQNKKALAYALGSKGVVLAKRSQLVLAEEFILNAAEILSAGGDLEPIVYYYNNLAEALLNHDNDSRALNYLEQILKFSLERSFKNEIAQTYLRLSEFYERLGNSALALENYKTHILYRDSLRNIESVQELANLRSNYEIAQKQSEVDILNLEKKRQQQIGIGLFLVLLLSTALGITQYRNAKLRKRTNLELTALNQTKDKFFSIISHDLRGPVSAFQGISGIIRVYLKKQRYKKLEEITNEIDRSVRSMSNLLDNLLNWAVQQQGQIPFNPEQIQIKDLSMEVIQTFQTTAQVKNIELSCNIPEELWVWADKNTLTTVIRNLVGNALKYTPEQGEVIVIATGEGEFCLIKVSDTGVGIPKNKQSTLFNSQSKVSSTRGTAGEKGLGLGTQLVHEFVKMNKGTIEVLSEVEHGTTFSIKLPISMIV